MDKVYRRIHLDQALAEAGVVSKSGAYQWLLNREKEGRIVCPRDPITKQRKFTIAQIQEIIKAFLPDGNGHWPNSLTPITQTPPTPVLGLNPSSSNTPNA